MNAREIIAESLRNASGTGESCTMKARLISEALNSEGFVILPRSEVEAIRGKALEIVAAKREEAESFLRGVQMAGNDNWSAKGAIAACNDIEKAIRSLKSGGE